MLRSEMDIYILKPLICSFPILPTESPNTVGLQCIHRTIITHMAINMHCMTVMPGHYQELESEVHAKATGRKAYSCIVPSALVTCL